MKSRRDAIRSAASAAALLQVLGAQQHEHASAAAAGKPAKPYRSKWLSAGEMKLLAGVCDIIIPRTDTPGAADARVHEHIDFSLQSDKARQAQLREGLRWMSKTPAAGRAAWLTDAAEKLETKEGRFFTLIKDLTIDGYYQSREGLAQELGWHGNTYLPEFKGCTHPEHQG